MREYLMVNGVQQEVNEVDRGPLLLRTREEWLEAYLAYAKGRAWLEVVVLVVLGVLVFILVTRHV